MPNGFIKVNCHKKSRCERPFDIITIHTCSAIDKADETIMHITPDEAQELAIKLMVANLEYMTKHNNEYYEKFIKPRVSVKAIKKSIQKGKL